MTTSAQASSPGPAADANIRICPSRNVLARIGEKWTTLVIVRLGDGPVRFGALRRRIEGVSQKMLTQTLRSLERDGMVTRRLLDTRPLSVEYELTALGGDLLPLAVALKQWAERQLKTIENANVAYDEARADYA